MSDNDRDADTGAAVRQHGTYFEAPAALRRDIRADIERVTQERPGPSRHWPILESLLRPALTFAAGAILAGVGVALLLDGPKTNPLVAAMISDHARSIVTGQTIEVASANTHTVKPWLSGRLGYSPAVVDLADIGYPLIGGRRGFIGRIAVGVMVYQYEQHEIDVYTFPLHEHGDLPLTLGRESGYNMLAWRIGDIQYVAVSDAGAERIKTFSDTLRQRQSTPTPVD